MALVAFWMPGWQEIIVILAIGLLLFGGRLPEVGKSLGKSLIEFRKGLRGLRDEVGLGDLDDVRRDLRDATNPLADEIYDTQDDYQEALRDEPPADDVIDAEVVDEAEDQKSDEGSKPPTFGYKS